MKKIVFIACVFASFLACKADKTAQVQESSSEEMTFDQVKWNAKEGEDYIYRDQMLDDLVHNDTVRTLKKDEILALLGEPSYYRDNEKFLYYRIIEKGLGPWTWHTKTLVIKFLEDNRIDWMKIHE